MRGPTTPPHLVSCTIKVGLTTKSHIPTPYFIIFIALHCIFSGFDPNFVTLYKVWSPNNQFYPILMMFWKVDQKQTKKTTTMNTTIMRFENETIFRKFPISLLELSKFLETLPFSASFDHLVQIIQKQKINNI